MYSVSDRYRTAITQSHHVIALAAVWDASNKFVAYVAIDNGSVSVDSRAKIHRRAKVDLQLVPKETFGSADPVTLTVDEALALLYPKGNELRLSRGIVYYDGTSEQIPLGVFRIARPRTIRKNEAGVVLSVDVYDRSRRISRALYTKPRVIAQGTNCSEAIRTILKDAWPSVPEPNLALTSHVTPRLVFDAGADPWDEATKIATAIGHDLFFDVMGIPTSRPIPRPTQEAVVWRYKSNEAGIMLGVDRDIDDENAYNRVVVKADNSELAEPIYGEAADTDPKSPTYIGNPYGSSPYGEVTLYEENQYIKSQAQANDFAAGLLRKNQGIIETVGFTTIVNPAHEATDVVEVQNEDAGVNGLYVIDGFTVPLGISDPMPVTTRQVRVL